MIIHDFDFAGMTFAPNKTNAPLVVDANAVLAFAIASKSFQAVARQRVQRSQIRSGVQHVQFAKRLPFDSAKPANRLAAEETLRIQATEPADHRSSIY